MSATNTTTTHTLTPWRAAHYDPLRIVGADGSTVVERVAWAYDGEFICRAVNAHDELVTALKRVQRALLQESGPEAADTFSMCNVIQNVVDAALAKAEARP